jgi:hypothetical protein
MNDIRFDLLARTLSGASRRSLLGHIVGTGLVVAFGSMPTVGTAASTQAAKRCRKLKGKKKQKCLRKAANDPVGSTPPVTGADPCETAGCVDEGAATCGMTGVCAAGMCLTYQPGTRCRAASCEDGVETLAAYCDEYGSCPVVHNNCGSAGCGPRACKRVNGARCEVGAECISTHCVGGACCNEACVGEHASAPGYCEYGTCILVCDSGWGNCEGPAPGACDTPLGTDTDCRFCTDACPFDTFCEGGQCVPQVELGLACTRHRQCASNWCIAGVCCNQNCLPNKCPAGTCLP